MMTLRPAHDTDSAVDIALSAKLSLIESDCRVFCPTKQRYSKRRTD